MTGGPLRIGSRAERRRAFDVAGVAAYRDLSGDRGLGFGEPGGVPGPLLAGMISDLLGTELPGPGTMWMKQEMRFPAAAPIGVEVVATVEVTRLRPEKGLVDLATSCAVGGAEVLDGRALVLVPGLAGRMITGPGPASS
jgi:acyl dehydratase